MKTVHFSDSRLEQSRAPSPQKGPTFQLTQRFVYDGHSRIPNFLNSADGRDLRSPGHRTVPKTRRKSDARERHAQSADQVTRHKVPEVRRPEHAADATASEASPDSSGWPPMRSTRARMATHLSQLSLDPRFDLLIPPYTEPLGPGTYSIERASPPLGPLPLESSMCGAVPGRDPWRPSQAFSSAQRPSLFSFTEGSHLGSYVSQDIQGHDGMTAWSRSSDKRAQVEDYRHATRHSEASKQLPELDEYSPHLDSCGKALLLTNTGSQSLIIPFASKQPRMACLPKERLNDTRLGAQRQDTDPASGGPGSYCPYTSIGAAKRKTYRLYATDGHANLPGSQTAASSLAFTSTSRANKFGSFLA